MKKATSSHTLRTLPRITSPSTYIASGAADVADMDTDVEGSNAAASSKESTFSSASEFGTMSSYKTARDWNEEEEEKSTVRGVTTSQVSRSTSTSSNHRALRDIWGGEGEEDTENSVGSAIRVFTLRGADQCVEATL